MRTILAFTFLILLQANGCDESKPSAPEPRHQEHYQRFVPVPREPANAVGLPWSGFFALDTKTGQLCRTYETPKSTDWDGIVLCKQLFDQYPD